MQGKVLTPKQLAKFIKTLKSTNGNVSKACLAIKVSRSAIYEYRKTDLDFSAEWDEVIESVLDAAEEEVYRRAVEGTDKPIFYQGEEVAVIKEYSDRLLEFMLKGGRPEKFRERVDIDANVKGNLDISIEGAIDQIYDNKNESENG